MCKILRFTSGIACNLKQIKALRLVCRLLDRFMELPQKPMKPFLVLAVILCSVAAFGQAASLSSQAVPIQMADHPQHASLTPMACERPLVGGAPDTYVYAQGERPLWEFGPVSEPVPLGDVARAYRKEKVTAKKAERIFEKQGS